MDKAVTEIVNELKKISKTINDKKETAQVATNYSMVFKSKLTGNVLTQEFRVS